MGWRGSERGWDGGDLREDGMKGICKMMEEEGLKDDETEWDEWRIRKDRCDDRWGASEMR